MTSNNNILTTFICLISICISFAVFIISSLFVASEIIKNLFYVQIFLITFLFVAANLKKYYNEK